MLKTILPILLFLPFHYFPPDSADSVQVTCLPNRPIIENDKFNQYLNFDFVIKNDSRHLLELSEIQVSLMDDKGKLVSRKVINNNGRSPGIIIIGNALIKRAESVNIFNPFYCFDTDMNFSSMQYKFSFVYADTKEQMEANKKRLPIDFDLSVIKMVKVRSYSPKTEFHLPLNEKMIIWDGHDFVSHHRRFLTGIRKNEGKIISANTNRYAYDMVSINSYGQMYKNSPFKKENWFVFGKDIFAPAGGKVVEVINDIPDNSFEYKSVMAPNLPAAQDPYGMGNYIIIDHNNGEYSIMLHMEAGSIKVKSGDVVKQGQLIGKVGFSGDAIFPHLHYAICNGTTEFISEGLPSFFYNYHLIRGSQNIFVRKGRIDSGDILEAGK